MINESRVAWATILLVACWFLYVWELGDVPFFTKGEPREALQVWEAVENGSWILQLRNGVELPSKPPLFHWLGALTALATGAVDEFSVRFPSAFLALLSVLGTFWLGARKHGTLAGVFAALVLATSFEWLRAATNARVDMALAASLTATFVALDVALSSDEPPVWSLVIAYVSMGLAVLAKGPVGWILPGGAVVIYLLLRRDVDRIWTLRPLWGIPVALAIPLLWYAAAIADGGQAFVDKQILAENFGRFVDTEEFGTGHEHSVFYLIGGFFTGFAPWSVFAIPLGFDLARNRRQLEEEGLLFPVVWFTTVFVFFSLAAGKRTVYLLPLYPAAAILVGSWWKRLTEDDVELPPWLSWLLRACGAVGVALVVVMIGLLLGEGFGVRPLDSIAPFLHPKDQANLPVVRALVVERFMPMLLWAVALLPLAVLFVVTLAERRFGLTFAALVAFIGSSASVVHSAFLPALAWQRTYRPFMEIVRGVVGRDDSLFFYETFDYGAVFYSRRHIPEIGGDLAAVQWADGRSYLILTEERWAALPEEDRERLQFLHKSQGTGPKGGKPLILVLYRGTPPEPPEETPAELEAVVGAEAPPVAAGE